MVEFEPVTSQPQEHTLTIGLSLWDYIIYSYKLECGALKLRGVGHAMKN